MQEDVKRQKTQRFSGTNQKPELPRPFGTGPFKPWACSIRPKFPEIPIQNRMEHKVSGKSFRKFRFTSRGCPFFWKFRKFLVPFGICTRYEFAPVPLAVKSFKMAASLSLSSRHYTGCKINCHSSSLFLIAYSQR